MLGSGFAFSHFPLPYTPRTKKALSMSKKKRVRPAKSKPAKPQHARSIEQLQAAALKFWTDEENAWRARYGLR